MTIDETVSSVFSRLAAGELSEPIGPLQDGWEVDLPSGRTVTRSMLQAETKPLVALGPDAVPHLLPWVANDNPALRYVAIHALGEITGEKPSVPYFDQADRGGERARAVETWRAWYEARNP